MRCFFFVGVFVSVLLMFGFCVSMIVVCAFGTLCTFVGFFSFSFGCLTMC